MTIERFTWQTEKGATGDIKQRVRTKGFGDGYAELLPGWTCYSTSARISAARGTASRTECIWLNPACVDRVSQIGLDLGERA